MTKIKHFPLDLILQININLFAIQQSIDYIQMSINRSEKQRSLSNLPFFFTINKILIKKKTHSKKKYIYEELFGDVGHESRTQYLHWPWSEN